MIEVENLTKSYGPVPAVQGISFTVGAGEIVGFLGPNGAGKTTTMRMLTGFLPPTDGRVKIAGYDVFEQSMEARREIGYLPENPPVYPDLTVEEYLRFVAELKDVPRAKRAERVERVIEQLSLGGMRRRLIGNLSKGYRQRVGLAQALVHEPKVLVLDEPTVGLDPVQIVEIRNLIKSLVADGKQTVILSTHILPEVAAVCKRVIIISGGKIVAQGDQASLTARAGAATSVRAKLKGDALAFERELGKLAPGAKVTANGESVTIVAPESGADLRESVFRATVASGGVLLEMAAEGGSLEDVFMKLTTKEEGLAPAQPPAPTGNGTKEAAA